MSRLVWFLTALALVVVSGCHPSKAEFDALQRQLNSVVKAQQDTAGQREHADTEEIERSRRADLERARTRQVAEDLALRVAVLEEGRKPPAPSARKRAGRPDPNARYRVDIGAAQMRGSATALVTIVEWADYQCPFCGRVQGTLAQIRKRYGKDVRVAYKHNPLPFHKRALAAAIAAEAAGRQGKFWKMHDLLFANSRKLSDKDLLKYAKKIRLKIGRFKKDLKDPAIKALILTQQNQGKTLGANGTPAFFINGRFLSGAQPVDKFAAVIDQEMAHARELTAAGVPRVEVYEQVTKNGLRRP